jgi:hypothetical protein
MTTATVGRVLSAGHERGTSNHSTNQRAGRRVRRTRPTITGRAVSASGRHHGEAARPSSATIVPDERSMKTAMAVVLCGVAVIAVLWATAAPRPPYQPPRPAQPTLRTEVERMADEVSDHIERLGAHSRTAPAPRASDRNPFGFAPREQPRAAQSKPAPAPSQGALEITPVARTPELHLIGVAEQVTTEGVERTAIISGAGQMFMVKAGDSVTDRYVVTIVGADAVELRDTVTDAVRRLGLP